MRSTVSLAAALLFAGGPALAASSEWFETEGARVRLVTTGSPGADGRLMGMLDIDLKPGWKTYWRDPGDAGVPPTVDVSGSTNVERAELDFPPPQRHDQSGLKWAGYDRPVALPIEFELTSPDAPAIIRAEIFLGICETICIPVQASLALDPASDPGDPGDRAAVSAALASLPGPERPGFRVGVVSEPGAPTLRLEAAFPGNPGSAELFIAGGEHYIVGAPKRIEEDGRVVFEAAIERLAEPRPASGLHYTLVTDAGSVSGLIPGP